MNALECLTRKIFLKIPVEPEIKRENFKIRTDYELFSASTRRLSLSLTAFYRRRKKFDSVYSTTKKSPEGQIYTFHYRVDSIQTFLDGFLKLTVEERSPKV